MTLIKQPVKSFPANCSPQRVLLTGARSPAAPDLVRWLRRFGHRVTVADSIRFPIGRAATGIQACLRYPSPRHAHADFQLWLAQQLENFDLIWPCCEEVLWVAGNGSIPVFAPNASLVRLVHSKHHLYQTVEGLSHHVNVPSVSLWSESKTVPPGFVAKPIHGRFGHCTLKSGARIPPRLTATKWILQREIIGSERSLFLIANQGELIAHVLYCDPDRHTTAPCTRFVRTTEATLTEFARRFVAHHQWTGAVGFDIITDSASAHWVVDINPRLTSGMHLIARPDAPAIALYPWRAIRSNTVSALGFRPLLMAALTTAELLLRFGWPPAAAATADLQWP